MYYKLYQSLHSILNDTRFRPTWGFFIGDFMKTNQDKFLTFKEQVQLFKDRGMIIEDEEKAERVLQFINYYKIKECSLPFFKNSKYISNITFDEILTRFYENKNLRINLLRLTEKVEISLKTKFSYLLGEEFGAYGYLNFYNWVDKREYCKHFRIYKEKEFEKRVIRNLGNSKNELMEIYKKSNKKIPVWLIIDILTFGEILDLYKLIYKKYQNNIAHQHNLDRKIYLSWLENINLIRNLSAHNSNIVDIKFTTKPKIISEFKDKLYTLNGKVSDRIAISVLILEYLVFVINLKYPGGAIKKNLKKLCRNKNDKEAQELGFKDFKTIENLRI